MQLTVSGAGKFSVMMEERTRGDAQTARRAGDGRHDPAVVIAYRSAGASC